MIMLTANLSAQELDLQVDRTVLDNGLTILTYVDHSFPTVSYQTFVNAGSRDELRAGATGVAHVFEHLMFRGTEKHPDLAAAYAHMGPQENAYTGQDYTCYFVNAAAQFLPEIISIEADRIRNLQLTPETFNREMGPIREERRRFVANSPDGYLEEQLWKLAYTRHTYEHPVIGWENDVEKNLSFRDANDFREVFYSPNYITIFIAGNFDSREALNLIQQYYGDWPSHLPPIGRIKQERKQTRERKMNMTWKSAEIPAKIAIGYHIPDLNYHDFGLISLQVAERILFSDGGKLQRKLKDQLGLVEKIESDCEGMKDPGLFTIWIDLADPAYRDSVLSIIYNEFEDVKQNGVAPDQIKRAVNSLKSGLIYRLDRPAAVAGTLGYYELAGGDYKLIFEYYEMLDKVKSEHLRQAASDYLIATNRNVVTLMPAEREQEVEND